MVARVGLVASVCVALAFLSARGNPTVEPVHAAPAAGQGTTTLDRAVARERPRAELRVRPARARQAAAQIRRPRRHARAHAPGERHHTSRRKSRRACSATTTQPVWQIGNEIVTGLHADHIRFPELPDNLYSRPTLIWTLAERRRARIASRRRISPRSCRGTPTTC